MPLFNVLTLRPGNGPIRRSPTAQKRQHSFAEHVEISEHPLAAMAALRRRPRDQQARLDLVRRVHGTATNPGEVAKLVAGIDHWLSVGLEAITPG